MNKLIQYSLIFFLMPACTLLCAQEVKIDSSYANWYYQQRMDLYEKIPVQKHDVVFLGNSITERGEWHELIPGKIVGNRGIGGDNTFGVLARLDNVIALQPAKVFLLIGINDIGRGLPVEVIFNNYRKIVQRLRTELPKTKVYVQSVLPLNESLLKYDYLKGKREHIEKLNRAIREFAATDGLVYVDLYPVFADEAGALKEAYTTDGIHLTPVAYVAWVDYLKRKKLL